jgi:hypothetical protein
MAVAKRLVDEAVVAKKLVVVAEEEVELEAVKFWRVVEPRCKRLVVEPVTKLRVLAKRSVVVALVVVERVTSFRSEKVFKPENPLLSVRRVDEAKPERVTQESDPPLQCKLWLLPVQVVRPKPLMSVPKRCVVEALPEMYMEEEVASVVVERVTSLRSLKVLRPVKPLLSVRRVDEAKPERVTQESAPPLQCKLWLLPVQVVRPKPLMSVPKRCVVEALPEMYMEEEVASVVVERVTSLRSEKVLSPVKPLLSVRRVEEAKPERVTQESDPPLQCKLWLAPVQVVRPKPLMSVPKRCVVEALPEMYMEEEVASVVVERVTSLRSLKVLRPVKPLLSVRRVDEAKPERVTQESAPPLQCKLWLLPVQVVRPKPLMSVPKRCVVEALPEMYMEEEVALVVVELRAVKFWRVEEPLTRRLARVV